MSWDRYAVGFVFGIALGSGAVCPAKDKVTPVVEERIRMDNEKLLPEGEKYIPVTVPFQEVMTVQQGYKPADKMYLPN